MSRGALLALAALLLVGWTGCAGPQLSTYRDALSDWTRGKDHYEGLEGRIFVRATLKTRAFRDEYIKEYSRIFAMTKAQTAQLEQAEQLEHESSFVVVVALATMQYHWKDLSPRRGIWEIRLQNANEDFLKPVSVTRLKQKNPTWQHLYPYFAETHWLFELRFDRTLPTGEPLAKSGETVDLIIAGAPAQIQLSWKLP